MTEKQIEPSEYGPIFKYLDQPTQTAVAEPEPNRLLENLPPLEPCEFCGEGTFWESRFFDRNFRCTNCDPLPSSRKKDMPRFAGRILFLECDENQKPKSWRVYNSKMEIVE